MHPEIKIFNFTIAAGWLMLIFGIISMILVNLFWRKRYQIHWFKSIIISLLVNVFAILGAKVLHILENLQEIIDNGLTLSGFSFYGTVFLLPLALLPFGKVFRMKTSDFLDFCTPAVAVELAVYRVGCFLGGCCYGVPASWGFAMHFDPDTLRVPVQLIEIVFNLMIFVFLLIFNKKSKYKGLLYPLFMIAYGFIRFILEFIRVSPKNILGFSLGQVFSIISIVIGIIVSYKIINKEEKKHERQN